MAKDVDEDVEVSSTETTVDVGTFATVEDGASSVVAGLVGSELAGRVTPFWRAHSWGSRPCDGLLARIQAK